MLNQNLNGKFKISLMLPKSTAQRNFVEKVEHAILDVFTEKPPIKKGDKSNVEIELATYVEEDIIA